MKMKKSSRMKYYHALHAETIARLLDKKMKVLNQVLDGKETQKNELFSELINTYKK